MLGSQNSSGQNQAQDYSILKEKFFTFASAASADPTALFLAGTSGTMLNQNARMQPNDISYIPLQLTEAFLDAAKRLERPNQETIRNIGQYQQKVGDILPFLYEDVPASTSSPFSVPLPTSLTSDKPFVLDGFGDIKEIISGAHMLGQNGFAQFKDEAESVPALIAMVRYLMKFIAMLDLTNVRGGQIIDFLYNNDILVFQDLFNQLHDQITGKNTYVGVTLGVQDNDLLATQGLLNGLKSMAEKLINDFKTYTQNIPRSANDPVKRTIETLTAANWDWSADDANLKLILHRIFGNTEANGTVKADAAPANLTTRINALGTALFAIDSDLQEKTGTASDRSDDVSQNNIINSLYNYQYLTDAGVPNEYSISAAPAAPAALAAPAGPGAFGAPPPAPAAPAAPAAATNSSVKNPPSFLYSPAPVAAPAAGSGRFKFSVDRSAVANTQAVDAARARKVVAVTDALRNVSIATNYTQNRAVSAVLGLLAYAIIEKKSLAVANDATAQDAIKRYMLSFVDNYDRIGSRYSAISSSNSKNITKNLISYLASAFFTNYGSVAAPGVPVAADQKLTLADPNVMDVFKFMIQDQTHKDLYSKYFNLYDPTTKTRQELTDAVLANPANFRLNVKKVGGAFYGGYSVVMRGGAPNDPILLELIPEYNPATMGDIWLTPSIVIRKAQVTSADFLKNIGRLVYTAPPGAATINILGNELRIAEAQLLARSISSDLGIKFNELYSQIINRNVDDIDGTLKFISDWESKESTIRSVINQRLAQNWRRDGNIFYKVDAQGTRQPFEPSDDCTFLNVAAEQCINFLDQCAYGQSVDNALPQACRLLVDQDVFDVNISKQEILSQVAKMNPKTAYAILKKFGFGAVLINDTTGIFKGLKKYEVESVKSWLTNLKNKEGMCEDKFKQTYKEIFKSIASKPNILNYFDILVAWVNANVHLLNPEFLEFENISALKQSVFMPAPNDRYNLYNHIEKPAQIKFRLRGLCNDLERLKSNVQNNEFGFNGSSIFSNVASMPYGMTMPLGRAMLSTDINPLMSLSMVGGHSQYTVQDLNSFSGSDVFQGILKDITSTMQEISRQNNATHLALSKNSQEKLTKKIEDLKELEKQILGSIEKLMIKKKLYDASGRRIDSFSVEDDKMKNLINKHSYLLQMTESYNQKAINVINILQTLANVVVTKIPDENTTPYSHTYGAPHLRPMNMNPF